MKDKEPSKSIGIDASEWIRKKEDEALKSLIPGNLNRTRELLEKLKKDPKSMNAPRGRPPKPK